jgi:hypothetical protein
VLNILSLVMRLGTFAREMSVGGKKKGRIGDVMKTPFSNDLRAFRLCNPPAVTAVLTDVARHWQER